MKKLLAIGLMFLVYGAYAQDPMYDQSDSNNGLCKDIKRQENEFTNEIKISSTPVIIGGGSIVFGKAIKEGTETLMAVLGIAVSRPEYGSKGVYVKFDDGTIYKAETAEIDCRLASGSTYWLTGAIFIDEDNKDYFSTKKIAKFALSDNSSEVKPKSGEKARSSFLCVSNTN